jgi:hypothetical protein
VCLHARWLAEAFLRNRPERAPASQCSCTAGDNTLGWLLKCTGCSAFASGDPARGVVPGGVIHSDSVADTRSITVNQ